MRQTTREKIVNISDPNLVSYRQKRCEMTAQSPKPLRHVVVAFVAAALTLFTSITFAQRRQNASDVPLYRFTVDYFTFGGGGFRSKERVAGDYRKNSDGTAEWSNVSIATAHALNDSFESREPQKFMNGFRYRPGSDSTKPEFFKEFPPNATSQQNLVWDTLMFESFAQQVAKVTETPYRLPPSDVPLAGSGTFQNKNVELTRTGTAERNGQRFVILHYDAFFNNFNLDLSGGMKMVGRSDYWGDIWVLSASRAVERATLSEEVIGEVRIPSQPNPQMVNVVRRGSFDRIKP
jgi:hypothetical protein